MLTLHQPQPSIWNLFQGLPFRCVEFHVNVAAEKGINEPNLAALPSFNKRKAQTKKFLSTSTLTFPRVALGSFSPPDKGAAPGSPISELASRRGRTDLGDPSLSWDTWCVHGFVFLYRGLEGPGNGMSVFSALNHLNLFNWISRFLSNCFKAFYRLFPYVYFIRN